MPNKCPHVDTDWVLMCSRGTVTWRYGDGHASSHNQAASETPLGESSAQASAGGSEDIPHIRRLAPEPGMPEYLSEAETCVWWNRVETVLPYGGDKEVRRNSCLH